MYSLCFCRHYEVRKFDYEEENVDSFRLTSLLPLSGRVLGII